MTPSINKNKPLHDVKNTIYMNSIINNCCDNYFNDKINKKVKKLEDKNIKIQNIKSLNEFMMYNFNVEQLKKIAKYYKLKSSGSKNEINLRIYVHLFFTLNIIKIQKCVRRKFVRKYFLLHGPADKNRTLCTNTDDFITMEPLKDINYHQFFSYKDIDGFIYGFNICSLYNLFLKSKDLTSITNPYNRNLISKHVIQSVHNVISLGKILKININLAYEDDTNDLSIEKIFELKALELFQNINALGNYSDYKWFVSLNRTQLIVFMRELYEIWHYRAQLTIEIKRNIIPPLGNPFNNIDITYINSETNLLKIKQTILKILEKFVNSGIDLDSKTLGCYYVLGALTLVNNNAADSLPWLFQSFNYF
jgi:hypothetical protein